MIRQVASSWPGRITEPWKNLSEIQIRMRPRVLALGLLR